MRKSFHKFATELYVAKSGKGEGSPAADPDSPSEDANLKWSSLGRISDLTKGRAADVGETRKWRGGEFKKVGPGKWVPVSGGGGPAKKEDAGGRVAGAPIKDAPGKGTKFEADVSKKKLNLQDKTAKIRQATAHKEAPKGYETMTHSQNGWHKMVKDGKTTYWSPGVGETDTITDPETVKNEFHALRQQLGVLRDKAVQALASMGSTLKKLEGAGVARIQKMYNSIHHDAHHIEEFLEFAHLVEAFIANHSQVLSEIFKNATHMFMSQQEAAVPTGRLQDYLADYLAKGGNAKLDAKASKK